MTGSKCVALEFGNSLGVKNISSHTHKTRSCYLLKSYDKRPNAFWMGVPSPGKMTCISNKLFYYLYWFFAFLFCDLVQFQDAFVHCKNDFHFYVITPLNM